MELHTFIDGIPRAGLSTLAGRLGISTVYLSQLRARQGGRVPSAELCVQIERATDRQVMRWDLRPDDWHRIWPELIGQVGAPQVKRAA